MPDRPPRRRKRLPARPAVSAAADPAAPAALCLAENLDLRAAAPLMAMLAELRGRDVSIDAGAVRRLGGQCLAVLLAGQAAWAKDRARFGFSAASTEFSTSLGLLGAASLLPVPGA